MITKERTQDFLFQNQSMKSVEIAIDSGNEYALELAKVRYLQSVILTPIVGTAGVVLMFYAIGLTLNRTFEFSVWLALGSIATFWRIYLFIKFKNIYSETYFLEKLKSYLIQTTFTAAVAGLAFGWGWMYMYPHLSPEIQIGFMFTNIVMLFGGLYAYSPHLRAYIFFSLFSLVPALWQIQHQARFWVAQSIGITLVIFVSQMFAFRWAQNFRHNVLLKEKNSKLLNELIEKKEFAEQATVAKSRFLATVSHDLRQPLHAINLYLATLQRLLLAHKNYEISKENYEMISANVLYLKSTTDQLTFMFEALLDISKLDAESTKPHLVLTGLETLINQLTNEFTEIAIQSGLNFDTKIPANIGQFQVMTDPIMLERILRNLLTNATSHTQKGSVRLKIVRKFLNGMNYLDFRIIDTGPGIKKIERNRIFEEFYQTELARKQLESSNRGSRNLGLGLAISARLASLLKTKIRVHSVFGRGSVFAFALPLNYKNDYLLEKSNKASINRASFSDIFRDKFIAIVDDDPFILDSTEKLLKSYGSALLTAKSQEQLFEKLHGETEIPNIFLIDHRLKSESGITLIQAIREKYGNAMPCILITGNTSADELKIFELLRLPVLYKPVSDKSLLEAIQVELQSKAKKPQEAF